MKNLVFKKALSYLFDIPVEKGQSIYSGAIELILRKGRFALCTDNAVYSFDDLYHNFRAAFSKMNINHYPIKKVLVLGMGLGSIPFLLEKTFKCKYHYTLVEIDPLIISFANKYRIDSLQSPVEIVQTDALDYVLNCTAQFDLIAVDLFIDNQVPAVFEQITFLQHVKKLMSPAAFLLFNRLAYNEENHLKTNQFYYEKFSKVFDEAFIMDVSTNKMLLNKAPLF